MKTFEKSSKLDNVLYDVRGPVVDEAARMEEDGMEILKLNIGNPYPFGFSAPQEVILDMLSNIRTSQGYSDSKGIFSARKAIMQYAQLRGIPGVTMNDIYTGNGVSELINLCMQALLDNGDEILIPAPDYPLWTATATLAGGNVVHYICDEQSEWYPDIDDIRSKITDKTKAIVIINPNNPTGAVYPKEILEQIVQIAREHELIIFSDEIYDRLIMDGYKHTSIASLAPDVFCVTFSGLSKSHNIGKHFLILLRVISDSGKHVTGDGGVDTCFKQPASTVFEVTASCCHSDICIRIQVAEHCNRTDNVIFGQWWKLSKRSSRNRNQCIDRDGYNAKL